ncbi:Ig-like domain-containing protein [Leifsonia sp. fls2-241-R2A-40a]|uniref:Ig-like domain-containing protein n=1 Tax=Leifsonia sp. fls2-241-R2A-40a TaxID=3040290 RepID=UPI00254C1138|nr:Ig-like domain-containing protein [Leifsonia sp. fls2-241-R2A-40a]
MNGTRTAGPARARWAAGAVAILVGAAALTLAEPVPAPAHADFASQCSTPTRTVNTGDPAIRVTAGETVLVASDYTGGVDALPAGGTLCVASGATLSVSYLNNAAGALLVAAGATLALPSVTVNTGFSLQAEGTVTAAGFGMNGNGSVHIAPSGVFTVSGSLSSAAGVFVNEGTFRVNGVLNENSDVSFTNSGTLDVLGSATVNGFFSNTGTANFSAGATVNGSGVVENECIINTTGDITNTGSASSNSGVVIATGTLINNGAWMQSSSGVVGAAGFRDDGIVTGLGRYRFTGPTSVQGSFIGDSADDPIVVQSTAPAGQIFDVQTGTVQNTVRGTVTLPDSSPGCVPDPNPGDAADIEVSKAGPAAVAAGGTVTYTVTATNHGPSAAEDVVIADTLPAGFTLDPASTTATVAGGVLTWQLGTMAPDASVDLTFSGTATAPVGSVLHNVVRGTTSTPDPDPSNNDGSSGESTVDTQVVPAPVPINRPPVAADLVKDTTTGGLAVGRVQATDPDAGQELTYRALTRPAHGTLYFSAGGVFVYRADDDFSGVDTFSYRACDNGSPVLCDTADVIINVRPRAVDDSAETRAGQAVAIPLLDNDTAGATLDAAVVSPPANGNVTLDPATGTAVYTPAPGFTGTDTFQYRICSPTAPSLCDSALVTVTVLPGNDPPVVEPLTQTTTVGQPATDVLQTSDPNAGDTLRHFAGIPPRSGTVRVDQDGTVVYLPRPGFAGRDQYTVIVCDDGDPMLCTTGVVQVEVLPIARPDAATTTEGTPVAIEVTGNDAGSVDPPVVTSAPAHGTVSFTGGVATYVPDAGFTGDDVFEYTICAVGEPDLCATTTVTVTVEAGGSVVPTPTPTPPPADGGGTDSGGSDTGLAGTGSDVLPALVLALLAVLTGVAATLVGRRRPRGTR